MPKKQRFSRHAVRRILHFIKESSPTFKTNIRNWKVPSMRTALKLETAREKPYSGRKAQTPRESFQREKETRKLFPVSTIRWSKPCIAKTCNKSWRNPFFPFSCHQSVKSDQSSENSVSPKVAILASATNGSSVSEVRDEETDAPSWAKEHAEITLAWQTPSRAHRLLAKWAQWWID